MNKILSAAIAAALATSAAYAGDDKYDEDTVAQEAHQTTAEIERSAESAADSVEHAADQAANEIEQTADDVEDSMDYAADKAESHMDKAEPFASLTADELDDVKVILGSGEEIGEIDEIGYSPQHGEKVAVIEVGGFLGIGERDIAVPFSQITETSDGKAQITMSRAEVEAAPEFDDDWLEDKTEKEDAE